MTSLHSKRHTRRFLLILFLSSLTFCLWLGHLPLSAKQVKFVPLMVAGNQPSTMNNQPGKGSDITAFSSDTNRIMVSGINRYQQGDIFGAIEQWQTALRAYQQTNNRAEEALLLENLARAYQQIGQSEQAISYWSKAIATNRQLENLEKVGHLLTELAQSYSISGQARKAIAILCAPPVPNQDEKELSCTKDSALQIARKNKDWFGEAAALGSLGEAYRLRGNYQQAIAYLEASLKIADELDNPVYRTSANNSLGNAYISRALVSYRRANSAEQKGDSDKANEFRKTGLSDDSLAIKHFYNSLAAAKIQNDLSGQMRALLNSIPSYYRTKAFTAAAETMQQTNLLLSRLPDSQDKVYAAIKLARFLQPITVVEANYSPTQCWQPGLESKALELLNQAVAIAERLNNLRLQSFALGELGHLYECRRDFSRALDLTEQAQSAANQALLNKDSLYIWDWQAGRILQAQSKQPEAIAAYSQAVTTLENIRSDLLNGNRDLQFDFRDRINPIYRELTQLRLEQATLAGNKPGELTKELNKALKTIDALKLAELQNYFGDDCIFAALPNQQERVDIAGADTATAVFSSIILKERTAILVSFPNGEKKSAWIDVDSNTLTQTINEFRRGLERYRDIVYEPKQAQQIYDWIVRPFTADLGAAKIKTLVFIQDGILRSVPMAALHDGEEFLVQKYAIATTPSLILTETKTAHTQRLRALAVGLTKEATVDAQKFPTLTNVSLEIKQVGTLLPGSKQLLDNDFTPERIQQELSKTVYPIIHIATHGQFGTEPKDTFLVTGNNDKLTIEQLEEAIRKVSHKSNSVELLALTACETAVGDDRAALGLAGVAVQAGVRSALASLWSINDAATVTLVTKFYTSLHNSGTTKAEALRAAQLALIKSQYSHPAYWAPFTLIGNWQ